MKQASQTALYGEVLTSQQQYRKDLETCMKLSEEEQAHLVPLAQAGDKSARDLLIEHCLPYVDYLARRYSRAYEVDYEELIGRGNLALCECLDKALTKDDIATTWRQYLVGCARGAMWQYCVRECHLIIPLPVKDEQGHMHQGVAYQMESLDTPLCDETDETLEAVIAAPCDEPPTERDYSALYQSVEGLPNRQKACVQQYYGLGDTPSLTIIEIQQLRGCKVRSNITVAHYNALENLRVTLLAHYPDLAVYAGSKTVRAQQMRQRNNAHASRAWSLRTGVICQECGATIAGEVKKSQRFCSPVCRHRANTREYRATHPRVSSRQKRETVGA